MARPRPNGSGPIFIDEPRISRWEIAGVPVVTVLYSAYEAGLFERVGIADGDVPAVMFAGYVAAAVIRAVSDRMRGKRWRRR